MRIFHVLVAPVVIIALFTSVQANPIPKPKPVTRPVIDGGYDMTWHVYSLYHCFFLAGGSYAAEAEHTQVRWEGSWVIKGDKITIKERLVGPDYCGSYITWTYTLHKGKLESTCGNFKLKAIK